MWTYWPYGTAFPGDTGLPMRAGTTASLDGTTLAVAGSPPAPDYYIAYASPTGEVFLETKDSGPSGVHLTVAYLDSRGSIPERSRLTSEPPLANPFGSRRP
jgi:hypothetical protein